MTFIRIFWSINRSRLTLSSGVPALSTAAGAVDGLTRSRFQNPTPADQFPAQFQIQVVAATRAAISRNAFHLLNVRFPIPACHICLIASGPVHYADRGIPGTVMQVLQMGTCRPKQIADRHTPPKQTGGATQVGPAAVRKRNVEGCSAIHRAVTDRNSTSLRRKLVLWNSSYLGVISKPNNSHSTRKLGILWVWRGECFAEVSRVK